MEKNKEEDDRRRSLERKEQLKNSEAAAFEKAEVAKQKLLELEKQKEEDKKKVGISLIVQDIEVCEVVK